MRRFARRRLWPCGGAGAAPWPCSVAGGTCGLAVVRRRDLWACGGSAGGAPVRNTRGLTRRVAGPVGVRGANGGDQWPCGSAGDRDMPRCSSVARVSTPLQGSDPPCPLGRGSAYRRRRLPPRFRVATRWSKRRDAGVDASPGIARTLNRLDRSFTARYLWPAVVRRAGTRGLAVVRTAAALWWLLRLDEARAHEQRDATAARQRRRGTAALLDDTVLALFARGRELDGADLAVAGEQEPLGDGERLADDVRHEAVRRPERPLRLADQRREVGLRRRPREAERDVRRRLGRDGADVLRPECGARAEAQRRRAILQRDRGLRVGNVAVGGRGGRTREEAERRGRGRLLGEARRVGGEAAGPREGDDRSRAAEAMLVEDVDLVMLPSVAV